MFGTDFEYDGKRLSDYGLMILSFNGTSNDTVSSGASLVFNQVKTASGNNFNISSSIYDSPYSSPPIQIGKDPSWYHKQEDLYFSPIEVSKIQSWLCQDDYCKLKVDQDGYENIYWNATFSSKQILINGRIVGLELSLFTDAPYGHMDEIEIRKRVKKDEPFVVYNLSDEITNIRPYMEIKFKESGDFVLRNSLDNLITEIKNVRENELITIYGRHQNISTSIPEHTVSDDFNYHFPIIVRTKDDNVNEYISNLNCEITIKYSPIIKTGI